MTKKQTEPLPGATDALDGVAEQLAGTEAAAENAHRSLAHAVRAGAEDARKTVDALIPALGKALRTSVYKGFYGLSYGATYGALTVGRLIPRDSAVARALHDGTSAATRDFNAQREAAAERATVGEGLATA